MESVLNVGVLARLGVAPPAVDGFRPASWSGTFGHGPKLPRASFVF